jgi:hypothetical protein
LTKIIIPEFLKEKYNENLKKYQEEEVSKNRTYFQKKCGTQLSSL